MTSARTYQPGAFGNSRPGRTRSRIRNAAAAKAIVSVVMASVGMMISLGPEKNGAEIAPFLCNAVRQGRHNGGVRAAPHPEERRRSLSSGRASRGPVGRVSKDEE